MLLRRNADFFGGTAVSGAYNNHRVLKVKIICDMYFDGRHKYLFCVVFTWQEIAFGKNRIKVFFNVYKL
jgi:hypothetical protein